MESWRSEKVFVDYMVNDLENIKESIKKYFPSLYKVIDWGYFANQLDYDNDVKYNLLKGVVESSKDKGLQKKQLFLQETFIPKARELINIGDTDSELNNLIFTVPSDKYILDFKNKSGGVGITILSWNNAVFITSQAADFCCLDENNNVSSGNVLIHEMIHQIQPNLDRPRCFLEKNGCSCYSEFIEQITILLAEKILNVAEEEKVTFNIASTDQIQSEMNQCFENKQLNKDHLQALSTKDHNEQKDYLGESFVNKWHSKYSPADQIRKTANEDFNKNLNNMMRKLNGK